ncbi:MAG: glycine zipper 2TM domain-containing protein [Arenimonas sp.]|uniref:glycine zipper 2TM domain-containing protein n=1 Tax=Arenimonas sp. TaxID=1872635 RepID=UPI0025C2213D|nr:glycine zipper 2TM domain-containing protein [Arenimonas sp.]MBW8369278.1 glycine zipper 2TM domain-containing protein [Arenimonas sp.]
MNPATRLFSLGLLPLALAALSGTALAQYAGDEYQNQAYQVSPMPENVSYGYAQVLRADEVVEIQRTRTSEERCDDVEYRQSGQTTGSTVIGAIVGAALGNQVGKGDGRKAATVAGAVAGGVVGNNIARNRVDANSRGCRLVEVEREDPVVVGYDVEYMYKGDKYVARLPYDPGNRLRVRVSVMPDDAANDGG